MVEVKSKPRPFELRSILSLSKCRVASVIGLRCRSESSVLALLQTHRIEADGLQPRDLTRINSYASVPLSCDLRASENVQGDFGWTWTKFGEVMRQNVKEGTKRTLVVRAYQRI